MIKNNLKDSSFRYIFKNKANLTELYYDISGNKLKNNEIEYIDTKNYVINELRNDIAFIKSDKSMIVLIEHQSSTNYNMDIRLLHYYVRLLQNYINDNYKYSLHTSSKIEIPKAEFYVLYNSNAIMDNSEKYRTPLIINGEKLNFNTKFIDINFDSLDKKILDRKDSLGAYSLLIKLYNEYKKKFEKSGEYDELDILTEKAYELAVNECKNRGYILNEFDREEFKTMTMKVLTVEEDMQIKYEAGIEIGRNEGISIGEIRGMLALGADNAKIIELTGATEEEILEIKNNM